MLIIGGVGKDEARAKKNHGFIANNIDHQTEPKMTSGRVVEIRKRASIRRSLIDGGGEDQLEEVEKPFVKLGSVQSSAIAKMLRNERSLCLRI